METISPQRLLAIVLVIMLAGCSPFYVDWDHKTIRQTENDIQETPLPPSAVQSNAVSSHWQSASAHPRKHKPAASPAEVGETSVEPENTQESQQPPSATTTISMADPGDSSGSAEKTVEATSQRLARFDRSRLNGAALATYDEANGFLNQGKQALAEKDYVAASGFAHKASVLADKLQANGTAR